ncbi:cyclic nucleotide-binding domain-containing protein [Anaerolineae bacterium CFX7]|nr:cyclic nucleotide-binding domain-containing protein [Anaerolineae bacterium CFX7]
MIPQPLDQVPLFARLSEDERELISSRLRHQEYNTNTVIFSAGRPAELMAVVVQGWVKLESDTPQGPIALANLGAGSLLGEVDLLLNRAYSTAARAATTCSLLVLSRNDLHDLLLQYPSIGLKFSATLGTRVAHLDEYLVTQRLSTNPMLSALSDAEAHALANRLQFRAYERGDTIFAHGDAADAAFLIESGTVRIITASREGEHYQELQDGEIIGQTALITGKPQPATAFAVTEVNAWVLTRNDYLHLIAEQPTLKLAFARALAEPLSVDEQAQAVARLQALPLFADADHSALQAIAERLVMRHYPAGELIYAEGTPGDAMYLCESGRVKLVSDATTEAELRDRILPGQSFGEMALLTGRTRAEAAKAIDDSTLWVLYKTEYDELIVQHPALSLALSRALSSKLGNAEGDVVERHLRQLNLFAGLSQAELREVAQYVQALRFRSGETICFAGQPAQFVYIIEGGEAREITQGSNGQTIVLDLLGPQESFGEQAVVQSGVYPLTVQAVGDIELWAITKGDFDRMLSRYPALALSVTRRMAQELERARTRAPRVTSAPPLRAPVAQPYAPPAPAYAAAPRKSGNGNGGNGAHTRAPQPSYAAVGVAAAQPQPARAQAVPLPGAHVGVRSAPAKPWARSGNVVRPMPASTARPVQRVVGAAHMGMAVKNGRPGLVTWFTRLSVGNKIATILISLFALWIVVMLPLWMIYAVLTSDFGGNNNNNNGDELPISMAPIRPILTGKLALKIKTATPTPLPPTPIPPTPEPTKKPVVRAAPKAQPTPELAPAQDPAVLAIAAAPQAPPLAPRKWDSRLGPGGLPLLQNIGVTEAAVSPGQKYWRLVDMVFQDAGQESGNDHTIYIKLIDENGARVSDKVVEISWDESGAIEIQRLSLADQKPKGDYCDCNYNWPMYGAGYRARVDDSIPSDKAYGMIMPMHRHVNYRLTFQRVTMP